LRPGSDNPSEARTRALRRRQLRQFFLDAGRYRDGPRTLRLRHFDGAGRRGVSVRGSCFVDVADIEHRLLRQQPKLP